MLTKRIAAVAAFTVFAVTSSQTANAQSFRHVDYLARQLQLQARDLQGEFGRHFRHAIQYRHLMSDARQMANLAAHIHEIAHHPHHGAVFHMQSDLRKLDGLFHHIEHLVKDMERAAFYGVGHVHGDTRHVRGKLRAMSGTLHHLKDDIDRMVRRAGHGHIGHNHGIGQPIVVPRRRVINVGPLRIRIGGGGHHH